MAPESSVALLLVSTERVDDCVVDVYAPAVELDALLISAESGAAYTLLYPGFQVVVPTDLRVSLPLFYAIGTEDKEMDDFLDHWISLRKKDGTMQRFYNHWILGQIEKPAEPRWCVIRNVLH